MTEKRTKTLKKMEGFFKLSAKSIRIPRKKTPINRTRKMISIESFPPKNNDSPAGQSNKTFQKQGKFNYKFSICRFI